MISEVLSNSANSIWPQISLIIFFLCFSGILIWTYTGRKNRFENQRHLPLENHKEIQHD